MHEIRPTTRRLAWTALALAGPVLLVGCGDDDDDEGTGDTTETTAPAPGDS